MKRKSISLLLALALILAMIPTTFAVDVVDSGTCGDNVTWVLTSDGTLTISGSGDMYDYQGAMLGMDENSVNAAPWFFDHCNDIKTIVIEPGVTRIGNSAFCNHSNISNVSIPKTVTCIGNDSFHGTYGLSQLVIPEGVVTIEDSAFSRCGLSCVHLPSTLTSIGAWNFAYSVYLEEVHFYGDAPTISDELFDSPDVTWEDQIRVTAYYPANNPTWTDEAKAAFGGWKTHTTWVPEVSFVDVADDAWYADQVEWAVENGITNGTDATHFSPEDICTRAQIVTFLWRSQGSPEPTSTVNPFVDVTEGEHTSWYYKAVLWAVENGITNGRDETHFAPDEKCLRSEVVMFLWRTAGTPAATLSANPFQDMTTEHWFYAPVMWAVGDGITNGVDDTHFGPDEECTRAQIVTFLYRYAN